MGELRVLLDTCALLWWWSAPDKLSRKAFDVIRDVDSLCLVSAASAWEVATKHRIGKLPGAEAMLADWDKRLALDGFLSLPIQASHALKAGTIRGEPRDPFDRMIASQSLIEGLPVITCDPLIAVLGARVLW